MMSCNILQYSITIIISLVIICVLHVCIYIHVCMFICICVYVYMCIYIYRERERLQQGADHLRLPAAALSYDVVVYDIITLCVIMVYEMLCHSIRYGYYNMLRYTHGKDIFPPAGRGSSPPAAFHYLSCINVHGANIWFPSHLYTSRH